MKLDTALNHLRNKFPYIPSWLIEHFLTKPNEYIGGRLPYRVRDTERLESLFDRWCHPADVF
jgi:hypothetical protein